MQQPPWDRGAEQAILSAMLIDAAALETARAELSAGYFFKKAHAVLFRALCRLAASGDGTADAVSLANDLKRCGELDSAGGMPYIGTLIDAVPNASGLVRHIAIVKSDAARRAAIDLAYGREGPEDFTHALARLAEDAERDIASGAGCGVVSLRELMEDPANLAPIKFTVPRMAPEESSGLWVSPPKGGKSTTWDAAIAALTTGGPWLDLPTRAGRALIIHADTEPLRLRVGRLTRFGADPDRVFILRDLSGGLGALCETIARMAPDLVVVDVLPTLCEAVAEMPESGAAREWMRVMHPVGRAAADVGSALVWLDHARRSDGSYRDSSAKAGLVDCVLEVREDKRDPLVRNVTTKARVEMPDFSFRYVPSVPGFELVGGPELPIQVRVHAYLVSHPGQSNRTIRAAIEGKGTDVDAALRDLARAGAAVNKGTEKHGKWHATAKTPPEDPRNPQGHAADTVGTHPGTHSGRKCVLDPHTPRRGVGSGHAPPDTPPDTETKQGGLTLADVLEVFPENTVLLDEPIPGADRRSAEGSQAPITRHGLPEPGGALGSAAVDPGRAR